MGTPSRFTIAGEWNPTPVAFAGEEDVAVAADVDEVVDRDRDGIRAVVGLRREEDMKRRHVCEFELVFDDRRRGCCDSEEHAFLEDPEADRRVDRTIVFILGGTGMGEMQ